MANTNSSESIGNKYKCAEIFYENLNFNIKCLFCNKSFKRNFTNVIEHLENHIESVNFTSVEDFKPNINDIIFDNGDDISVLSDKEDENSETSNKIDEISHTTNKEEESDIDIFDSINNPILNFEIESSRDPPEKPEMLNIVHRLPEVKSSLDDGFYRCPYENCEQVVEIRALIQIHMINKHMLTFGNESDTFECPYCDSTLSSKRNLMRHLHNVHSTPTSIKIDPSITNGKYYCPKCNNRYLQLSSINKHIRTIHEEYFLELMADQHKAFYEKTKHLEVDGKKLVKRQSNNSSCIRSDKNLDKEIDDKTLENELYECDLCTRVLKKKRSLVLHKSIVHKVQTNKCAYCRKKDCSCPKINDVSENLNNEIPKKYISENTEFEKHIKLEFEEVMETEAVYAEPLNFVRESIETDPISDTSNKEYESDIDVCDSIIDPISNPETELMLQDSCILTVVPTNDSPEKSEMSKIVHTLPEVKLSLNDCLYRCPYDNCERAGSIKDLIQLHMINMHLLNPKFANEYDAFECPECDSTLSSKTRFMRHINNFHNIPTFIKIDPSIKDGQYYCPICNEQYLQLSYINKHIRNKHEEYFFALMVDQHKRVYSKAKHLKANDRKLLVKKKLQSKNSSCIKETVNQNLEKPRAKPSYSKLFKCNLCTKVLARKSSLKRHKKIVHKIESNECADCRNTSCNCLKINSILENLNNQTENKNSTENTESLTEFEKDEMATEEEMEMEIDDVETFNFIKDSIETNAISDTSNKDDDSDNDIFDLVIAPISNLETESTIGNVYDSQENINELNEKDSNPYKFDEKTKHPTVFITKPIELSMIDNLYHCPYENCNRARSTEILIQTHIILVHTLELSKNYYKFECPLCTVKIKRCSIYSHLRNTHGILTAIPRSIQFNLSTEDFKYHCPKCNEKFMQFSKLNSHIKFYHEEYFIDELNIDANSRDKQHQSHFHFDNNNFNKNENPNPNELKCEICDKELASSKKMYYHKLTHQAKRYQCHNS